jgi:sporulation protein YlmC with PRC-barrel domain
MTAAALAAVLAAPAFAQSPQADKPKTDAMQQQQPTAPKANKGMTTGQNAMDKGSSSGAMDKSQGQNASSDRGSGSMDKGTTAVQDKTDAGKASMAQKSAGEKKQAGFLQTEGSDQWRASKLIGASVVGPDNKSIGDINEILLDKAGGVEAVVVGVGGFLGIGEKNVAIPFDSLNVQRTEGQEIEKITVSFSKEELENAPKFAYAEEKARAATTGANPGRTPLGARPATSPSNPPAQSK